VSTTLYTYVAAPYAPYLSPNVVSATVPATISISGVSFTGMASVASSVVFLPPGVEVTAPTFLNDSVISATINSPTSGVFDLVVTTPEGKTTLKSAVTFN
jgi:hypothetical protein